MTPERWGDHLGAAYWGGLAALSHTMWIETTNTDSDGNPVTRRLKNEHTDGEFVEFNDNGKANVTKDVGERLVEHGYARASSSEATSDSGGASSGDADGEVDDATDDTGDD